MTWRWPGRGNDNNNNIGGTCPKCKFPSAELREVNVKGIARWWCEYCIADFERTRAKQGRI